MDYMIIARALRAAADVFAEAHEEDVRDAQMPKPDPDNPTDEAEDDVPFPKDDEVTLEQLQQRAGDMIRAGDREKLKAVLKKFKVMNLSSAETKDYEAIWTALTEEDDD